VSAAPGVSRRGLFSVGVARLVPGREDIAAVGAAMRGYREAEAGADPETLEERARREWSIGDRAEPYAPLAPAAAELVEAAGVREGQAVLDAGAGDGNVALAAAARGARVVALDLIPAAVECGRLRCELAGAPVDWRTGNVERLPFPDGSFDAVLSNFGAMFAPRPRAVAAELARVARPGAPIAMTTWTSSGFMGRVLDVATQLAPQPPGVPRPSRWGRYESAFLWLGSAVEGFEMSARPLPLEFPSPEAAWARLSAPPGPLAAALAEAGPDRRDEARRRVLELVDVFAETNDDAGVRVDAGSSLVSGRAA
jgi:SAM-dependent methyltransferase